MKNLLLIGTFMISMSTLAADVCTNKEGSIIYDSSTTVGNMVLITKPRLKLAKGEAYIDAVAYDNGGRICRAMGMPSGEVGDISTVPSMNDLVAEFDMEGNLLRVQKSYGSFKVDTVTCRK